MKSTFYLMLLIFFMGTHTHLLAKLSFKNPDEMLTYVKQYLPENPVILEAGGHFGEDTIRMKSVWPNAIMHVFEPLPSSFNTMLETLQNISDVHCYPYALSTYSGFTDFYINTENYGASSINPPVNWNKKEFTKVLRKIPCITLDEWAKQYGIDHIDFMWLDMEGHELHALRHGADILKTVKAIYTEISYIPVRVHSGLFYELKALLAVHGLTDVWRESYVIVRYSDALFIKEDLLNR